MDLRWLDWAKRLQAVAQNGLTYAADPFDVERYEQVRQVAAEMVAAGAGLPVAAVLDVFGGQSGYATPKVDVRGVVVRDDAVLLVRERQDGRWTLPGGWADPCESPREAVVREVFEEAGFETRAVRLLAVYDRSKHAHDPPFAFHVYKLFIACALLGGTAATSAETDAVGFFRVDDLPPLSPSRVTADQIRRAVALARDPARPAEFD
jgi:ADP-ribose pyrophosphatase YjhB (NUDIX family)